MTWLLARARGNGGGFFALHCQTCTSQWSEDDGFWARVVFEVPPESAALNALCSHRVCCASCGDAVRPSPQRAVLA